MTTSNSSAEHGAPRRARAEALLARYPSLSQDEMGELKGWFSKEASSLDVGLIASNEAINSNYREFRAAHVDRLKAKDLGYGVLFLAACGGTIGLAYLIM